MVWYYQLQFRENPLDSRPNTILVGVGKEEEKVVNHILKGELCFLNGPTGSGKTSLLKRVQKKLKGYKFVYLDADDTPRNFDIETELKNQRSIIDRIMGRKTSSKKVVLLVDEAQAADEKMLLKARSKWEHPYRKSIQSIIVAQIDPSLKNVSGSFKDRLGKRTVSISTLQEKELENILKIRLYNRKTKISYYNKLSPEAVKLIIQCSGNNPRRLLEYADLIFDFHFRKFRDLNPILKGKDYKVSYCAAEEILKANHIIIDDGQHNTNNRQFNRAENSTLQLIFSSDCLTTEEISRKSQINMNNASAIISSLRKKGAIATTSRKGKKKAWELKPAIRRELTNR